MKVDILNFVFLILISIGFVAFVTKAILTGDNFTISGWVLALGYFLKSVYLENKKR